MRNTTDSPSTKKLSTYSSINGNSRDHSKLSGGNVTLRNLPTELEFQNGSRASMSRPAPRRVSPYIDILTFVSTCFFCLFKAVLRKAATFGNYSVYASPK